MVKAPTRGDAAGRNIGARLKTAEARTMSSQLWLNRQINDPFVKAARAKGYRSRAAFKLAEIDDRFHLIRKGCRVIDLGCAPGGWVQVALERGAGAVVGIDLLPVDPLPPAILIEGDFTTDEAPAQLIAALGGPPDLLLSDMAPNTIGHPQTDHLRIVGLVEMAAAFAVDILPLGGAFVTKAFQGGETADLLKLLKANFTEVKHFKPKSSRAESSELYLVALGRR
jgi:23S rRNA (uridine2552-2'-O)-methyltransferase